MGKLPTSLSLIYLAVCVAICIQGSEALKCYSCGYLNDDGRNATGSVANCISGSTPNSTYLATCSLRSSGLKMLSQKDDGSVEFRDAGLLQTRPNMSNFGCYKIHGEGTFLGKKRTWTERGCFVHYKELKSQCKTKTMKKWKDGEDLWSLFTYEAFFGFAEDDKVSTCHCTKDNCNSAPSSISTISFSFLVGAATLAFARQCALQ